MAAPLEINVKLRLSADDYENLRRIAEKDGRPVSNLMRLILVTWLRDAREPEVSA